MGLLRRKSGVHDGMQSRAVRQHREGEEQCRAMRGAEGSRSLFPSLIRDPVAPPALSGVDVHSYRKDISFIYFYFFYRCLLPL